MPNPDELRARVYGLTAARTPWKSALHPRGRDGRFINVGGAVKWLVGGREQKGEVTDIKTGGDGKPLITVRQTDGQSVVLKPEQISEAVKVKAKLSGTPDAPSVPAGELKTTPGSKSGIRSGTGTKDDPIITDDIEVAVKALQEDKYVQLNRPDEVATLLDKLAEVANEFKAQGVNAKGKFDLCKVTVPMTNIFCAEAKVPDRLHMPQLGGVPSPGTDADKLPKDKDGEVDLSDLFIEHLSGMGIGVTDTQREASHLRASQGQLDGATVAGMMTNADYDPGKKPIFVTRDGYVVDGHHRWAAVTGRSYKAGEPLPMNVREIDASITDVLRIANEFATGMGMPQRTMGEGGPAKPDVAAELRARVHPWALSPQAEEAFRRLTSQEEKLGFTGRPTERGLTKPTTGYSIGVPGSTLVIPPDVMADRKKAQAALVGWMDEKAPSVASNPNLNFGGWTNEETGEVYLDLSEVYSSREQAIAAAKARDEIAIWDIEAGVEIPIGGTGGRETVAVAASGEHDVRSTQGVRLPAGLGGVDRRGEDRLGRGSPRRPSDGRDSAPSGSPSRVITPDALRQRALTAGLFDAARHPRGRDGRFIEIGGLVSFLLDPAGETRLGHVTGIKGRNITVKDRRDGTSHEVPARRIVRTINGKAALSEPGNKTSRRAHKDFTAGRDGLNPTKSYKQKIWDLWMEAGSPGDVEEFYMAYQRDEHAKYAKSHRETVMASGTIDGLRQRVHGLTAAAWDEALHPRGHDGRFIEIGALVRFMLGGKPQTGKVSGIRAGTAKGKESTSVITVVSADGKNHNVRPDDVLRTVPVKAEIGQKSAIDVPSDRELATQDEMMDFLMKDGDLRVPASRYGTSTSDVAPVAIATAEIEQEANGTPITEASLDFHMGLAVNDSDDTEYLIKEYGTPEQKALLDYLPDEEEYADTEGDFNDYDPDQGVLYLEPGTKSGVGLTSIRIEDRDANLFSGVDSSGDRVTFRASDQDAKDLTSIMTSDLGMNFSGVDVDAEDIVDEVGTKSDITPFTPDQIPAGTGARDFFPDQTRQQIGAMNILAISGGRVTTLTKSPSKFGYEGDGDTFGKPVGLELPVSSGYAVRVFLGDDDTYVVQRTWRGKVKGEQRGVYADEVGEAAYQAGMYKSNDFGGDDVGSKSAMFNPGREFLGNLPEALAMDMGNPDRREVTPEWVFPSDVNWGKFYGGGDRPSYISPEGPVWMFRKGQKVRFYNAAGDQVGPEQANVAPAAAFALSTPGWGVVASVGRPNMLIASAVKPESPYLSEDGLSYNGQPIPDRVKAALVSPMGKVGSPGAAEALNAVYQSLILGPGQPVALETIVAQVDALETVAAAEGTDGGDASALQKASKMVRQILAIPDQADLDRVQEKANSKASSLGSPPKAPAAEEAAEAPAAEAAEDAAEDAAEGEAPAAADPAAMEALRARVRPPA